MDPFFPPYPNQGYVTPPNGSSQETGPSCNMEPLRSFGPDQYTLPGRHLEFVDESTTGAYQCNSPYDALAHATSVLTEGQGDLTEHAHCFGPSMYPNNQQWPTLNNYNVGYTGPYQVSLPYNAHAMSDHVNMTQWTTNGYLPEQLSSGHFTSVVSQPHPVTIQSTLLPDTKSHLLTSHLSYHRYSSGAVYAEQEQSEACRTTSATTEAEGFVARIGSVLGNGKFVCDAKGCGGQTFTRPAELKRHHTTIHSNNKPDFWCHVPTCRRSMSGGGEAFHRKDKLVAHVQSKHSHIR